MSLLKASRKHRYCYFYMTKLFDNHEMVSVQCMVPSKLDFFTCRDSAIRKIGPTRIMTVIKLM